MTDAVVGREFRHAAALSRQSAIALRVLVDLVIVVLVAGPVAMAPRLVSMWTKVPDMADFLGSQFLRALLMAMIAALALLWLMLVGGLIGIFVMRRDWARTLVVTDESLVERRGGVERAIRWSDVEEVTVPRWGQGAATVRSSGAKIRFSAGWVPAGEERVRSTLLERLRSWRGRLRRRTAASALLAEIRARRPEAVTFSTWALVRSVGPAILAAIGMAAVLALRVRAGTSGRGLFASWESAAEESRQCHWREAEAIARNALHGTPNWAPLHLALAQALEGEGRVDEALAEMDEARRLDPLLPLHDDRACLLELAGRPADSIKERIAAGLGWGGLEPMERRQIAARLAALGDVSQARRWYDWSAATAPSEEALLVGLAELDILEGDGPTAIARLAGLAPASETERSHLTRALAARCVGQTDTAVHELDAAAGCADARGGSALGALRRAEVGFVRGEVTQDRLIRMASSDCATSAWRAYLATRSRLLERLVTACPP